MVLGVIDMEYGIALRDLHLTESIRNQPLSPVDEKLFFHVRNRCEPFLCLLSYEVSRIKRLLVEQLQA
jgi:hypothetical protein